MEKTREGAQDAVGLGNRAKMVGNDDFKRGVWAENGNVPGKNREGSLMGLCQQERTTWIGSVHLDFSFGPQLIGGLHLFVLEIWSQLFHNCARTFWLP